MKKLNLFFATLLLLNVWQVQSQCNVGEIEVSLSVHTDIYGNELYWQLVPQGNNCGTAPIATGGNILVGCNGGNDQVSPTGGYASNATYNLGPWCLTDGASYDLIMVDDWDDGANRFELTVGGYPMYEYTTRGGTGGTERFTFLVAPPLAYNMGARDITTPKYFFEGTQEIKGKLRNFSANVITSLTLNYSINNGATVSSNVTGLSIASFTDYNFVHPTVWVTPDTGEFVVKIWASNPNGNADMDVSNDELSKTVVVLPAVPDLIDQYLFAPLTFTNIATSANSIAVPRDLDFHPDYRRYELWTILKETEQTGGKTVTIYNAGKPNQTSVLKQDGNAWHFMSLPTAIAFSENENFATSPGVYDANHDGGMPFTGPTLWSSDPIIYAQPSGGNGSHMDMLHESPYSMGICSEKENVFWVMDGDAQDLVRYDFVEDHGPGASDHSDGTARRFHQIDFQPDPTYHVPSHCVLDKKTNWIYMTDFGSRRVMKMDITTGTPGTNLTPHEAMAEYREYDNPVQAVVADTGFNQPCGIEVFGNRLLVSDHANGDIRIYDITAGGNTYMGKIATGAAGIMGIKVGPDGKIWYVNATQNKVVRIDGPVQQTPGALNCDSFCVVSVAYTTGYLDVTILSKDTNFINYPIVQVIAANGDTVGNPQGTFDFFGQMPNTSQTYHIPTSLTSFPANFNGDFRFEDGLFHNSCVIDWCGAPVVLSTDELPGAAFEVQLYPNPAHDRITLTSSSSLANSFITLYDLQGRIISEWKGTSQNTQHFTLPAEIAKGLYLLRVKNAAVEKSWKLEVQ